MPTSPENHRPRGFVPSRGLLARSGLLLPQRKLYAPPFIKKRKPLLAAFSLTDLGEPTTLTHGTISTAPFTPSAGSLVYVVAYEIGSGSSAVPGPNIPTDGTANVYGYANGGFQAAIAIDVATFFFYYAVSPGPIQISYATTSTSNPTYAGFSATLIAGSSGAYDSLGSADSGGNNSNPHVSSPGATVNNELAIGTVATGIAGTTFTQDSGDGGWVSPPGAFSTVNGPVVLSGNQALGSSGIGVNYAPVANTGLGVSGHWTAFMDLFEPGAPPSGASFVFIGGQHISIPIGGTVNIT